MRNTLNQGQRKLLIEEYHRRSRAGEPSSQNTLAEWAAQKFNLQQKPSQATISRLLKNRLSISKSRAPDSAKRAAVPKQPALEDALFSWVVDQKVQGGRVTSGTVRDFGRRLLKHVNEKLPGGRHLEFRFSNGWMEKYKKRYGLKFWRSNEGHDDERDECVLQQGYPAFVRKLSAFKDDDIWTAAEFGVQYRINPDSSISTTMGQDENKMTVLACCNKSGSEKYPLYIIGKSSTSFSIDEQTMKDINFEYTSNIRAWMTAKLFFHWLHSFDAFIGKNRERKVLLVLNSCSAHGNHETVPLLKNVDILFLPSTCMAKTLAMECGITSLLKLAFKRQQLFSVLDGVDQGLKNAFNVNPVVAMRWLSHEWITLPPNLIQRCWQQSLGNIDPDDHQVLVESRREEAYEINELLNDVGRVCSGVSIRSLLCSLDDSDCIETVNLDTLGDSVVDRLLTEKMDSSPATTPLKIPVLPPVEEQLKAFAIVRQILDQRGMTDKKLRAVVRDVQREIRIELTAQTGRNTLFSLERSNQLPQSIQARQVEKTQHAQHIQQSPKRKAPPSSQLNLQPNQFQRLRPSPQHQQSPKSSQSHQSQSSEHSENSQPSEQTKHVQRSHCLEKNYRTSSPVQVQGSAAASLLSCSARTRSDVKSSEVPSFDHNKISTGMESRVLVSTGLPKDSVMQVDSPQLQGEHANVGPTSNVPIAPSDDERQVRDEENLISTELAKDSEMKSDALSLEGEHANIGPNSDIPITLSDNEPQIRDEESTARTKATVPHKDIQSSEEDMQRKTGRESERVSEIS